jgi:O-methyltransferase domain
MTGLVAATTRAIVHAYDFSSLDILVDVGGGHGELLAAILAANPGLRGVLLDQPHVVDGAPGLVERAGVADRCEIVGGSFFEAVPTGADAYLLKSVLHDWDDPSSLRILQTCRAAMPEQSRLLVVESVVGPPNSPDRAKLADLNMLVTLGGRERTADEFRALLAEGGFQLTRIVETAVPARIIEASPA